jgi:hypothetical protein
MARTHTDAADLTLVMSLLGESLELCRGLNDRLGQASSLSYLGTFQHELASDDFAANSCLSEALRLYDELGHRLGIAEVLIRLGDLYAGLDSRRARQYYERARQIARAIGAVYEEFRAIEGLGTIDLAENHPGSGSVRLLRARETFMRMGSPRAQDMDDLLAGL